jgi:NAD-dependent SIR2 family protein deacetylase
MNTFTQISKAEQGRSVYRKDCVTDDPSTCWEIYAARHAAFNEPRRAHQRESTSTDARY